jgi:hypothetical protein
VKPYISWVAPRLLDTVEYVSPLGKGGDGEVGIANMTVGFLIISAEPMDPLDENHEVIHVYQYVEMAVLVCVLAPLLLLVAPWWVALVVGLWAWLPGIGAFGVVYGATYLYWIIRLKVAPGEWIDDDAYYMIPFEREAYLYDQDLDYLPKRKWFAWVRIAPQERASSENTRAKHILGTILTLKGE